MTSNLTRNLLALGGWLACLVLAALLGARAWDGRLGLAAAALTLVLLASYIIARRATPGALGARLDLVAKGGFTVLGLLALLRHPIEIGGGERAPVYEALAAYIGQVETSTFVAFALLAMAIKFSGVIASACGWHLLLVGQGIRFPFWSMIMTSFLIGRFIGTFLPSTLGLDGYTLYEASRYSNQWARAAAAKALEKIVGIAGLFAGMVLTLPFGYAVLGDVGAQIGRPEVAPWLAAAILVVAGGVVVAVLATLLYPRLLTAVAAAGGTWVPGAIGRHVETLTNALAAYRGQRGVLLMALSAKVAAHLATAVVYYFTALAIGVVGAQFWPIVFGSTVQILATLLSPTIAGEGAREAFQALLLSQQLGGVAQAVLSAALGFLAAEAATLWGGLFLLTRTPSWRPRRALVDGTQVDYAWFAGDTRNSSM